MENNTERITTFINNFMAEDARLRAFKKRKERKELTDRFTIALCGMLMILDENEREHTLNMLYNHNMMGNIIKSIDRINKNQVNRMAQLGYA